MLHKRIPHPGIRPGGILSVHNQPDTASTIQSALVLNSNYTRSTLDSRPNARLVDVIQFVQLGKSFVERHQEMFSRLVFTLINKKFWRENSAKNKLSSSIKETLKR